MQLACRSTTSNGTSLSTTCTAFLLALSRNQFTMLFFHDPNDLDAHYYLALSKSICKELLNSNLRLISIEMAQKQFVGIFNKSVVTFCL